jgi:hypothetical protein
VNDTIREIYGDVCAAVDVRDAAGGVMLLGMYGQESATRNDPHPHIAAITAVPRIRRVFITILLGKAFSVRVTPGMSVHDLLLAVQAKQGLPPCLVRLVHGGEQLDPVKLLTSYRIPDGARIHLVLQ